MDDQINKLNELIRDLNNTKDFFYDQIKNLKSSIHIYTHLDADGLASGGILGKALYRASVPFQITILRQLEREEIAKIAEVVDKFNTFAIFADFGSGQYLELEKKLSCDDRLAPFIILDHHLPQDVPNRDEIDLLKEIHEKTVPWHINPYFHNIDGSTEISGAGICYYFAKCIDANNIDLSHLAIIGAIGDIQNKGPNRSLKGANILILGDAINSEQIEVADDLNFSSIKPLNEAIAYSSEINLPGLTNDASKTLKFLQTLGILMQNAKGEIKSLTDLSRTEKQKISSAIIEYSTIKLGIEPKEIVDKLITKKYLLKGEPVGSILHDSNEFSNLLNSCGRMENGSLGIAIAMGDRKNAFHRAEENLTEYKKSILQSLSWIHEKHKIQSMENIQYFFGEDVIPENIIGTIASMLIFDTSGKVDITKPIFGCAKRADEDVYKISARAQELIVDKGVNLSEAIREASKLSEVNALGGGHPPAAGTKVPVNKIDMFLKNCDIVIKKQLLNK